MTHSNPTIHHANACYVLAISHLINSPGDNTGAFAAAKTYAEAQGNEDIKDWFQFMASGARMPGSPQIGWAKIGFTHAFGHLVRGSGYAEALRETLALGGDTDTNAAIVGGLVGAVSGIEGLPSEYVEKVTGYTYAAKKGRRRPDFLNQTEVLQQLEQLYTLAPATATVVIGRSEQPL
jgi:ADP-ribosylglycohydrolase